MLTSEGCSARRARLWESLPPATEWVIVADPRHVFYFSGFLVNPLSFSAGERGLLLLERAGGATLLADNFTRRSAVEDPCVDREVVEDWYDHRHSVVNRDHALFEAARAIADRIAGRPGAVEAEWLPLGAWQALGLENGAAARGTDSRGDGSIDLGSTIRALRRQKEPDEIALLRVAIAATEAGQARAREVVRAGVSEFDVYREVHAASLAAAGRPIQIYGDFRATRPDLPKVGGPPTSHVLQPGDLFVLDYSVVIDGYRSDFTNTIAVGPPSDKQYLLFDLCRAAMESGEQALRAGARARDVHAAVAAPFRASGYGDAFPHHAGHGIGLAHPEPPILVPESDDVLIAGDVVTLEPGLYVAGIGGIRIEHDYLITESGFERLSNHLISLT